MRGESKDGMAPALGAPNSMLRLHLFAEGSHSCMACVTQLAVWAAFTESDQAATYGN